MKALIILPKTSRYSPAKIGNFRWNDEYGFHLWDGRALEIEEFNRISKRIFFERREEIINFDLPPYVQLVEEKPESGKLKAETPEIPKPKTLRTELKRKTALLAIPGL